MTDVPVPDKRNSADNLENFARRIEARLRLGREQGPAALERLVCRLLTGKDRKVAAVMASKMADWKYGKARETLKVEGTVTHEHVTITEQLTDAELEQVEKLIESAESRANQK